MRNSETKTINIILKCIHTITVTKGKAIEWIHFCSWHASAKRQWGHMQQIPIYQSSFTHTCAQIDAFIEVRVCVCVCVRHPPETMCCRFNKRVCVFVLVYIERETS